MIIYNRGEDENDKEFAYRILKNNIMTNNLKPGEHLMSEVNLSKKLNISRANIREAIAKLRNERLLDVKPQSGINISLINWELIEEAIFMRCIIEKCIMEDIVDNFDKDILIKLENNLFAQKLVLNKKDKLIEFYELDIEFHRLLFLGSKKINIWEDTINMNSHYNRILFLSYKNYGKMEIVNQHEKYLEILKNKDKDEIKDLIINHIKYPINHFC